MDTDANFILEQLVAIKGGWRLFADLCPSVSHDNISYSRFVIVPKMGQGADNANTNRLIGCVLGILGTLHLPDRNRHVLSKEHRIIGGWSVNLKGG